MKFLICIFSVISFCTNFSWGKELHQAVIDGNLSAVKTLIVSKTEDPNGLWNGETALHLAFFRLNFSPPTNRIEILRYLLENEEIDLNWPNFRGIYPFEVFLEKLSRDELDISLCEFFIKRSASIQHKDATGKNILHWAIKQKRVKLVKKILKSHLLEQSWVAGQDFAKNTPLDYAVEPLLSEIKKLYSKYGYTFETRPRAASLVPWAVVLISNEDHIQKADIQVGDGPKELDSDLLTQPDALTATNDAESESNSVEPNAVFASSSEVLPKILRSPPIRIPLDTSRIRRDSGDQQSLPKPEMISLGEVSKTIDPKVYELTEALRNEVIYGPEELRRPDTFLRSETDALRAIWDYLKNNFTGLREYLETIIRTTVKTPGVCSFEDVTQTQPNTPPAVSHIPQVSSAPIEIRSGKAPLRARVTSNPQIKASPPDSKSRNSGSFDKFISHKLSPKSGSPRTSSPRASSSGESPGREPLDTARARKIYECEQAVTQLLQITSSLMVSAPPSFKEIFRKIEELTLITFENDSRVHHLYRTPEEFAKKIVISSLFLRYVSPRLISGGVTARDTESHLSTSRVKVIKVLQRFVEGGYEEKEAEFKALIPFFMRDKKESPLSAAADDAIQSIYQSVVKN